MSKRFTETGKWDDRWFRRLPPKAKLLWLWMLDGCDQAGVIAPDFELASFQIGETVAVADIAELGDRVIKIGDGKYWVPKFIYFQCGDLSAECRAHRPIFALISRHFGVHVDQIIRYPSTTIPDGHQYPITTVPDGHQYPMITLSGGVRYPITTLPDGMDDQAKATLTAIIQRVCNTLSIPYPNGSDTLSIPYKKRKEKNRIELGVRGVGEEGHQCADDGRHAAPADEPTPEPPPPDPPPDRSAWKTTTMRRLETLFGRHPNDAWGADELRLLGDLAPLPPEQIAVVERLYATPADEADPDLRTRRRSLRTLLEHWPAEVDRARAWAKRQRPPDAARNGTVDHAAFRRFAVAAGYAQAEDEVVVPEPIPADLLAEFNRWAKAQHAGGQG